MRNGYFEDYKPIFVMVGLEIIYAALSLLGKVALAQGMSAKVLVVYRQGLATLALAPVAYCSHRRNNSEVALGMKSFSLLFLAALLGTTLNQYFYFLGLHLGSAALATAMINLIPAITFIMAASLGLEKVSLRSSRSIAKIGGTILCVGGAMAMALLKGPKLLGMVLWISNAPHDVQGAGEDWVMGCVFLLGSCCCWSLWLILQVPISKCCSGPVSMAAWMCFLGFLQSAVLTFFLEPDSRAWRLGSSLQIFYCIYAVSSWEKTKGRNLNLDNDPLSGFTAQPHCLACGYWQSSLHPETSFRIEPYIYVWFNFSYGELWELASLCTCKRGAFQNGGLCSLQCSTLCAPSLPPSSASFFFMKSFILEAWLVRFASWLVCTSCFGARPRVFTPRESRLWAKPRMFTAQPERSAWRIHCWSMEDKTPSRETS
uniref:Auxin-induced protein 5NG4 n=1 Tax=Anthurium amnicola TaxID=1678845 RepID=A0A1D1Y0Q1_9ARAE